MKRYMYPITYGWLLGMFTVWVASGNRNPVWSVSVSVVLGLTCIWVTRRDRRIERLAYEVEHALGSSRLTQLKCRRCNGSGKIPLTLQIPQRNAQPMTQNSALTCSLCGGKGHMMAEV